MMMVMKMMMMIMMVMVHVLLPNVFLNGMVLLQQCAGVAKAMHAAIVHHGASNVVSA